MSVITQRKFVTDILPNKTALVALIDEMIGYLHLSYSSFTMRN